MGHGDKVHLKLTATQHRALLKALQGGDLGDVHALEDVRLFVEPGHFGGDGLWSDLGSEVKKVQKSSIVRGLEKKAVNYGAKALRGATEGALDGIGDTVATAVGIPEVAPALDAAIDRGASALQKRGIAYLDDKIDQSGNSVRYMASGGGMRIASLMRCMAAVLEVDTTPSATYRSNPATYNQNSITSE